MRIKHSNKRIVFETALTILCGCFVVFACLVDFIDIRDHPKYCVNLRYGVE